MNFYKYNQDHGPKKFFGFQNFRKKVFTLEEVDIDRLNLPEES